MPVSPLDFLDPQVRSLLQGGSPRIPTGIPRNIAKLLGQSDEDELSPEEERSLLGTLGHTGMSGLQWLGETLDKPGAAVRGLLAGRPDQLLNLIPLSDTFGITDPSQRTSGRDLLENMGMAPNQEGLDLGDVAGFATEVLTDPLTFITGAGALKAVSPAGRVAKRAGLLDDALKAASKAGKGPRNFLRNTTFGDVWSAADEVGRAKLGEAAAAIKVDPSKIMEEKLGDVLGATWKPMGHAKTTFGTQGIAEKADKLGEWLRYGNPVGLGFGRAFRPVGDATSAHGQKVAEETIQNVGKAETAAKRDQLSALAGMPTSQTTYSRQNDIRDIFENRQEGLYPAMDELLVPEAERGIEAFRRQKGFADPAYEDLIKAGHNVELLDDPAKIAHVARQMMGKAGEGFSGRGGKTYSPFTPNELQRNPNLTGWKGGTKSANQIVSDVDAVAAIKAGGKAKDVGEILEGKYGHLYVGDLDKQTAKFRALAGDMIDRFPESSLDEGIPFGSASATTYSAHVSAARAKARGEGLLQGLSDVIQQKWPGTEEFDVFNKLPYLDPDKFERVGKILDEFNMTGQGALESLLRSSIGDEQFKLAQATLEPAAYQELLSKVKEWRVPKEIAKELSGIQKTLTGPEPLKSGMRWIRSLNALSKAVWLATSKFHARNLGGGVTEGAIQGHYANPIEAIFGQSKGAQLAAGKTLADVEKNPAIQRMMDRYNLPHTNENANRVLQIEIAARNPGALHFATDVGPEAAGAGRRAPDIPDPILAELIGAIPGRSQTSVLGAGKEILGGPWLPPKSEGGNILSRAWRGLTNVRGYEGFLHKREPIKSTGNPLFKFNEAVGRNVEERNRIGPWLNLVTKQGVDPDEAWKMVNAAQVNYDPRAWSGTEKQWLSQIFPFYKYTKGKSEDVLHNILDRPGGPHAQIIKESARLTSDEPGLPEHVTGQLAIPIPEGTPLIGPEAGGDPRFLTGLGLMHEQPLGLLGPNMLRQLMSQLTPMAKLPIELGTRELLFQPGADLGGRAMEDADPNIGRIIANLRDQATGERTYKAQPFGGQATEAIFANSPFAAWLTSIRAAADPRKGKLQKALNLATGVRTTDVNQASRDAVVREALQRLMKQGGAQEFTKVYFDPTTEARMTPQEFAEAQQMEQLAAILASRAKARKKQRLETTGKTR